MPSSIRRRNSSRFSTATLTTRTLPATDWPIRDPQRGVPSVSQGRGQARNERRSPVRPSACGCPPGRGARAEPSSSASRKEAVDDVPITVVAEAGACFVGRQSPHLVDLLVGLEAAARRLHCPVPHLLRASVAVLVLGGRQLGTEYAAQPRLLFDLAQGRLLEPFARIELPLGQRPVV